MRLPFSGIAWLIFIFSCKAVWAANEKCTEIKKHDNANVKRTKGLCTKGCSTNTVFLITCKDYYYFENQDYADGQQLKCTDGKWVNSRGLEEAPAPCKTGCLVLSKEEMKNATYMQEAPTPYRNGNKYYWPANTRITTQCKDGFAFDFPAWREKGNDDFTCIGDGRWKRPVKSVVEHGGDDGAPARCKPFCDALDPNDDFATGTVAAVTPDVDTIKGKKIVNDGYRYQFKCEEGLFYDKNGQHAATGTQELICVGGDQGYYDPATQQTNATPQKCAKPGCTSLRPTVNKNATMVGVNRSCSAVGNVAVGCVFTIKCKENHFYDNEDYANGMLLTCTSDGWVDQNKKPYNYRKPPTCNWGCQVPSDADMANATYEKDLPPTNGNLIGKNGGQTYWSKDVKITTRCKKGFVRAIARERDEPNSFVCLGGSEGWINLATGRPSQPGRCDPICTVLPTPPEGTVFTKQPEEKLTVDGVDIVYPMSVYAATCKEGYEYPKNSIYRKENSQLLHCKGGALGYYDLTSGAHEASVYPCQKVTAEGCDPIMSSTVPNAAIGEKNCAVVDGKMPKNCELTIKCNSNYYPNDIEKVINGVQTLICKAERDGWVDLKSQGTNATTVKCLPGCDVPTADKLSKVAIAKPADPSVIVQNGPSSNVIIGGSKITIKCKDSYIMPTKEEREKETITLVCVGGNDGWINEETQKAAVAVADRCIATCPTIEVPLEGTSAVSVPEKLSHNGGFVVIQNQQYIFKCSTGFQYPENSPYSKDGKQILECKDGSYYDPIAQRSDAQVTLCVRGENPGCKKIDIVSPPPHTVVTTSKGCTLDNGKTVIGCALILECENGYFTVDDTFAKTGQQSLRCVDDGVKSEWVDQRATHDRQMEFIECQPGCPAVQMPNTEVISLSNPQVKNGNKLLYKPGTVVMAKCKNGTVPPNHNPGDAAKPHEYECKGGTEGWINKGTGQREQWPGQSCVALCKAVDAEEGFTFYLKPETFLYDDEMKVKETAEYEIKCKEGYHYPESSIYAKDNTQRLECGPNGKYIDKTAPEKRSTAERLAKCIRDVGVGCIDIVQTVGAVVGRSCDKDKLAVDGCKLTVECKKDYFPKDSSYHSTGKQELTCKLGHDWIDQNDKVIKEPMDCLPGCIQTPPGHSEVDIIKSSGEVITVDSVVYMLPSGKVTVKCKEGYVWTGTKKIAIEHHATCQGGDQKWRVDSDTVIDVMEEACTGLCPLPKFATPAHAEIIESVTVHEHNGAMHAVGNTSYVYACKKGYVYAKGSPHRSLNRQTLLCNGNSKVFEDVEAQRRADAPESCVRTENADECKEIVQNNATTEVEMKECVKDSDYYQTGCTAEVSCKQGYYPGDDQYLKLGKQVLRCEPSGEGWTDQYTQPITQPLTCVQGCIERDRKKNTPIKTNRFVFTEVVTYKFADGASAKCVTRKGKTVVTTNVADHEDGDHQFYCSPGKDSGSNVSTEIEFDDRCDDSCLAIRHLPEGVEIHRGPQDFGHEERRFVLNGKQYVLKCKHGYAYPNGTKWNANRRQILQCKGDKKRYDDLDTGEENAKIANCEKLKGCAGIEQLRDTVKDLEDCTFSGKVYSAGCAIKLSCPLEPAHYPTDAAYLKDGFQKIVCANDGSGWKDQFGKTVSSPYECTPGCIERSTTHASSNQQYHNLSIKFSGKTISCFAGTLSSTPVRSSPDDHKFYCSHDGVGQGKGTSAVIPDSCTNACLAILDIPASVEVETAPRMAFQFKGIDNYVVPNGNFYVFKCKDSGAHFMTDNEPKRRKMVCDGPTSTYTNGETGERNVKLIGCTKPEMACSSQH